MVFTELSCDQCGVRWTALQFFFLKEQFLNVMLSSFFFSIAAEPKKADIFYESADKEWCLCCAAVCTGPALQVDFTDSVRACALGLRHLCSSATDAAECHMRA